LLNHDLSGAVPFKRWTWEDHVDVRDKEMTGFTRHGNEGDEDKALKKAFKFLESKSASMSPALRAPLDL